MRPHTFALASLLLAGSAIAQSSLVTGAGRLLPQAPRNVLRSPRGTLTLTVEPRTADFHRLTFDVTAASSDGRRAVLRDVAGEAFLPSDVGAVVVVEQPLAGRRPAHVTVLDAATGQRLLEYTVAGLADARLAEDGRWLAYADTEGIATLDLATLRSVRHPRLATFAAGPAGFVAGLDGARLRVRDANQREVLEVPAPAGVRAVAFAREGGALWASTATELVRVDLATGRATTVYRAAAGVELCDLAPLPGAARLGLRVRSGARQWGEALDVDARGRIVGFAQGPVVAPPAAAIGAVPLGSIPWPIGPGVQHPVGNTYGEFQDYGGAPYPHSGIDVLGQDGQPVYAVAGGVVKAILTTSGQYHWRVAIADQGGAGTSEGYLYAHLDLPTIAVQVGDVVQPGQYLGDLVPWPVASFTHCHFARIEESGAVWSGSWLCTENPHLHVYPRTETEAPVFENARGSDLFAFCRNETSTYLDPQDLDGQVDIVAHVGDRIASPWVCAVQELSYTIHPVGFPDAPVVDEVSVVFDMPLDTYQGGPNDPVLIEVLYKEDSVCNTDGDYGSREFFHILTNTDGDLVVEGSDKAEAWNTTLVPNGDYVVTVTARDAAGNSTTASMTVTVAN